MTITKSSFYINRSMLFLSMLLFLGMGNSLAQHIDLKGSHTLSSNSQPKQDIQNISIADLKPSINYDQSGYVYEPLQKKPGWALISSAILPGSGQAANQKWVRAGLYLLAEAAMVGIYLKSSHDAQVEEQRYKRFVNNNWSVVNYAKWLVEYHEQNGLSNSYIDELQQKVKNVDADYDPQSDWEKIDIELLRNVEQNTPFVYPQDIGNINFSHVMPDYGSQQYYELISKYYQYGPGWNDFGSQYQLQWDGSDMPEHFLLGFKK